MKKCFRSVIAMVMVVMIISCFMAISASAAYDEPEPTTNQAASTGWSLYIDGAIYEVSSDAYVGWGSTGRNVYIAQIACNYLAKTQYINCNCGDADSKYGTKTNEGIKGFQSYCNANAIYGTNQSVDGKVGPVTWNRFANFLYA